MRAAALQIHGREARPVKFPQTFATMQRKEDDEKYNDVLLVDAFPGRMVARFSAGFPPGQARPGHFQLAGHRTGADPASAVCASSVKLRK